MSDFERFAAQRILDLGGGALPPAVEGCVCSHTVHMDVPGSPVELNADADCPIHGEHVGPKTATTETPHQFVAMPASSIGSCHVCSRPEGYRTHTPAPSADGEVAREVWPMA